MKNDKIETIGISADNNVSSANTSEIVLYQPNSTLQLEVHLKNDTVWLTQAQMVMLFGRDQSVISKHIRNVFNERELEEGCNMQILHITNIDRPITFYSLNVIISVGYRVKSQQGTEFRIWATNVLRDYMLRGYAISNRVEKLEYRVTETEKKIDFFVRTALPALEGIFYDGQVFDAYAFVADLVKSAKKSIVLIDNYIDESVLMLLSKRVAGVEAVIYPSQISPQLQLDLQRHNSQYPPIELRKFTKSHDRFLIIDNTVYHIGASLKDLGKKWFAFNKMEVSAEVLLGNL